MISACPLGSGWVLQMEYSHRDLLNYAYTIKSQYKLWSPKIRWGSWLVVYNWCKSDMFWGHGSFLFAPRAFSLGHFWLADICLLYNKILMISIAPMWLLWVILANFWTSDISGKLHVCNMLVRAQVTLESRAHGWHLMWE